MTRTARQIVALCRALGLDLPPGEYRIERTRAGFYQRQGGAWSWQLSTGEDGPPIPRIGSQWAAGELLRASQYDGRVAAHTTDSTTELVIEPIGRAS